MWDARNFQDVWDIQDEWDVRGFRGGVSGTSASEPVETVWLFEFAFSEVKDPGAFNRSTPHVGTSQAVAFWEEGLPLGAPRLHL